MDETNPYEAPTGEIPKTPFLRKNAAGMFAMTGLVGLVVIGLGIYFRPGADIFAIYMELGGLLCFLSIIGLASLVLEKWKRS